MPNGRTFGTLVAEARTLLNDEVSTVGAVPRNSDAELFQAINGAFSELRARRPDLFLAMGLRNDLPMYSAATDMATPFPFDLQMYTPLVYYIAGRMEIREDSFGNDQRAVTLLNKFFSMTSSVSA